MLQQTQVKTVIPFWERWMRELPTVQMLANAHEDRLLKLWEGLGYYRRVRHLQRAARQIIDTHHSAFPKDFDSILALPGIGRYTAGAICSIAFDQPAPILDGNVIRVLTRVYGIRSNPKEPKTLKRLWDLASEWVKIAHPLGKGSCSALNQGMMELGATVCTPTSPHCDVCPLRSHCVASKKNLTNLIPATPQRDRVTQENRIAFVVEDGAGEVLIRQRPAGLVNAGLWEFPNELSAVGVEPTVAFHEWSGIRSNDFELLLRIEHSITRYRITMTVYRIRLTNSKKILSIKEGFIRYPITRLQELAFPSAHRRVVKYLQRLSIESGDVALSKK